MFQRAALLSCDGRIDAGAAVDAGFASGGAHRRELAGLEQAISQLVWRRRRWCLCLLRSRRWACHVWSTPACIILSLAPHCRHSRFCYKDRCKVARWGCWRWSDLIRSHKHKHKPFHYCAVLSSNIIQATRSQTSTLVCPSSYHPGHPSRSPPPTARPGRLAPGIL